MFADTRMFCQIVWFAWSSLNYQRLLMLYRPNSFRLKLVFFNCFISLRFQYHLSILPIGTPQMESLSVRSTLSSSSPFILCLASNWDRVLDGSSFVSGTPSRQTAPTSRVLPSLHCISIQSDIGLLLFWDKAGILSPWWVLLLDCSRSVNQDKLLES